MEMEEEEKKEMGRGVVRKMKEYAKEMENEKEETELREKQCIIQSSLIFCAETKLVLRLL